MNRRDYLRLCELMSCCEAMLALGDARQSMQIWRGDMRAIVAAWKEIARARELAERSKE